MERLLPEITETIGPLAAAWHEGYVTCLWDFHIQPTTEQMVLSSTNPHADRSARRILTEYERFEIRNALGYHFGHKDLPGHGCGDEVGRDETAEILEVIVERILARRPERGA